MGSNTSKSGAKFFDQKTVSEYLNHSSHHHHSHTYQFTDLINLLKRQQARVHVQKASTSSNLNHKIPIAHSLSISQTPISKKYNATSQYPSIILKQDAIDQVSNVFELYQRLFDCWNSCKQLILKRNCTIHHNHVEYKKTEILSSWRSEALEITKKLGEFILIFSALKIEGDIYLEFKDFINAIKAYQELKTFCDDQKRYKEKIICYEQIGICYRLLNEHAKAIKYFRKQLELSWEQKDDKEEVIACDNLALEYYYLGDLEKSNHFNDRMMRGKLENNSSVIKRVSRNLILSKRKRAKYEYFLNQDQLNAYLAKKQQQNKEENVDFGLSNAYYLLPHFVRKEEEDIHSYDEDDESENEKKEKKVQSLQSGPNFQYPELKFLNSPPPYEYLPIKDPLLKKTNKLVMTGTMKNNRIYAKNVSLRDYIGNENFKYELPLTPRSKRRKKVLDGNQIFRNILDRVRKHSDSGFSSVARPQTSGCSTISHQSLLRMQPKNQIILSLTEEALERSFDLFKQLMKKQMLVYIRKHKLGISLMKRTFSISRSSNLNMFDNSRHFYGYESEISFLDYFIKKKKEDKKEGDEIKLTDHYGNSNYPLIVTGDEGCGKTALVVQWLTKNILKQQGNKHNHVIIKHFAGVSNCDLKYQSFIFRTLVKLRQEYDIQHRVEIIDDKLRMNFSRWLEIASQKHEGRLDSNSKILLILDGLENFHDVETGGEESADWIPWTFPNFIKVILMTRKNSKAMNHFKLRNYPIMYMDQLGEYQVSQMIEDYISQDKRQQISHRQLDIVINELITKRPQDTADLDTNSDFSLMPPDYEKQSLQVNKESSMSLAPKLSNKFSQISVQNAVRYFVRKNYLKNIITTAESCPKLNASMEKYSNPLLIKSILNFYLIYNKYEQDNEEMYKIVPLEINVIMEQKNMKWVFITAIKHFKNWIFGLNNEDREKFDQLLGYIYISRKGITQYELLELIPSLNNTLMKRFLSIFGFLLVQEKDFIFIKHSSFKKAIKECVDAVKNEDKKVILHRNMATVIEKEQFTLRQVDELSHQYFMGKCWIKLKDLISNIEVFSIMFVPEIKHELASYWQCLEQHKYDPVAEYNKALEGFVVKYRPNNQELFVILIQLSRFFKELADLETKYTPQFKHPPLRGQSELESITLLGELQKLDDLYNQNTSVIVASEPLLGDVENFNVDNTIVREQIMSKIKQELEEQKNEKNKEQMNTKEEKQIFYYYKRWIWVQFPWCTIDVYSNLSNIMEMSMGNHTNYISTAKENELVNGTIQILKEAKLRKKNKIPGSTQQSPVKKNYRSQSPSIKQSSPQNRIMARRSVIQKKITVTNNNNLPPIAPAKNYQSRFGKMNQSMVGERASSVSGILKRRERSMLSMTLENEDRKSPEKMLIKLTDEINKIEKEELLNLESQNVGLGSDLNQITFSILRKEKELKYLEEMYEMLQSEENLNQQEKVKLEETEAKLLRAYENLNRVEVEKKRLEQIFTVCQRNPAKNQEWIRNLESQVESMRKLVRYKEQEMSQLKNETEDLAKQKVEMLALMEDKKRLREQAIFKVQQIIDKKNSLDQKVAEVEEQRQQILNGAEGPEKQINKLKQRQLVYKKWISKLQVTKAFVNEKKNYYEKSFRKITAVTGISNPNDIEGLLGFIERTNDLRKTKQLREKKIDKMKQEKVQLMEELRNFQSGQPQYDHSHFEHAQRKYQERDKKLMEIKTLNQKCLNLIANVKSGIINIGKCVGMTGSEILNDNISTYIDDLCQRYEKVMEQQQLKENQSARLSQEDSLMNLFQKAMAERSADAKYEECPSRSEEKRMSSIHNGGTRSDAPTTPMRKRNKQPKQSIINPSTINDIQENAVDTEREERDQLARDRIFVKSMKHSNTKDSISQRRHNQSSSSSLDKKTNYISIIGTEPNGVNSSKQFTSGSVIGNILMGQIKTTNEIKSGLKNAKFLKSQIIKKKTVKLFTQNKKTES